MTHLDYTKILDRLLPRPDGESGVRHRTGTVTALNSDGTVDVEISGVEVPSVSCLAGAPVDVGDTVQIAAWRGDLLILGRTRTADQDGPRGVLGYAEITSSQTGISSLTDITGLSVTVDVASSRMIRIEISANIRQRTSPALAIVRIREGSTNLRRSDHQLAADGFATAQLSRIVTPSAGSHTYKASAQTLAGTMEILADNDVTHGPAHILVADLGAA